MHPRIVCKKHDVADRLIYPLHERDATSGQTALETFVETYKQPPVGLAAFPLLRRAEALERLLPVVKASPAPPATAGKAKSKGPPPSCASCQVGYSPMWHPAGDGSEAKTCHRCHLQATLPPAAPLPPPPAPPAVAVAAPPAAVETPPPPPIA